MTAVKVGIATLEQYKQRTMAIARGEHVPDPEAPKIWFDSVATMARVWKLEFDKQEKG